MATIGDRLKVLSTVLKLSITDLGTAAGLGQSTTNRWVDKDISFWSNQVEKFITYHRVNIEWWKTGEGEPIEQDGSNPIQLYERLLKSTEDSRDQAIKNADRYAELLRLALLRLPERE